MKKVWKKIGKYFIIVLLLLVGLACAGVLYLFFVPGSSLFNITYISHNSDHNSKKYANVSTVVMNSRNYKVNVLSTDDNTVSVTVHNNSFGFVLTQNKTVSITEKKVDDTIEFNISEPYGFALQNNSYINLYIPSGRAVDLQLKNNFATTTISSDGLKIEDLTYTSNNGTASLDLATLTGDLTLNLGNSTFNVTGIASSSTKVNLDLTTGKFDGSLAKFNDVTVNSNVRGIVLINECNNFYEEVKTAGGRIEINKAYHALIKTSDTNVYIKEVTNNVIVELTKSGNITIDTLNGISDISTTDGHTSIKKANSSNLFVESKYGNITISEAFYRVNAITNHGTINVSYSDEAESYNTTTKARSLNATIKGNGKINASGIDNVNVTIEENGRANISMTNVYGVNAITSNKGSVNVKINKDSKYKLNTISTAGLVRVNLTQVPEFNGYTKNERETYVNCISTDAEASANTLLVKTETGSLTVLDTNF